MLTLPLVDHKDVLVGVMQVLNKADGVFDADDEVLATALAAQCAVALQRVRMTEALIEGEKMRQELEMARVVQMSTLPVAHARAARLRRLRHVPARGAHRRRHLRPRACSTRGCSSCWATPPATASRPALSVTQMQAMLRMAFRLGADLETAFTQVNNQLAETLPTTASSPRSSGCSTPRRHRMRFHSGGQGPILHFQAADRRLRAPQADELPAGARCR